MSKKIIGYRIGVETTNPRVTGAKFISVSVGQYCKVNPAQELLQAAQYRDHSLENTQFRVLKMRELRVSGWFERSWHQADVTFSLQGSTLQGNWYYAEATCHTFDAEAVKILHKLKAAAGDGGDRLQRLVAALQGAGAVEIASVELTTPRGTKDWIYVRKDELDAAARRAEAAIERQESNGATGQESDGAR